MEAPGTAPGSEKLHFDAVYRHSRHEGGLTNISESCPLRKSETVPASMDQKTVSSADLTSSNHALPLGPVGLTLSVVGIVAGAIVFCGLVGLAALLLLVANIGTEAATEFVQDLRFDLPLATRLGAGVVSSLYIGVAVATLAMARWRGGRAWPTLLALTPQRRRWRSLLLLAVLTLAYAAVATTMMTRISGRHVEIAGPTDFILIGTILANLLILAPLAEEMLFRGWLFTGLRRALGVWPAGIVTAILFAAIHYDANHRRFFLVLPLAIALGVAREIAGSIRPTLAIHAIYNLIIVAITLAWA